MKTEEILELEKAFNIVRGELADLIWNVDDNDCDSSQLMEAYRLIVDARMNIFSQRKGLKVERRGAFTEVSGYISELQLEEMCAACLGARPCMVEDVFGGYMKFSWHGDCLENLRAYKME